MKKIDRFMLGEEMGGSDIAVLYQAEETLLVGVTRAVLVKVFAAVAAEGRASEGRFANEVRNLAAVGPTPHVVELYAAGVSDKLPWIAMEPATATVATQIGDVGVDAKFVGKMLENAAVGLAAIHARELLHNDVRPANIVIAPDGTYKIAELSLAASASAEMTQQAEMIRFAAPEVFAREFGKLSPSTDFYALGQAAYEMALGTRVWRAQFPAVFEAGSRPKDPVNPAKWMAWHCSMTTRAAAVHELVRNFPPALGTVIERLMEKDPKRRYQGAGEVIAALREAAAASAAATPAMASGATGARGIGGAAGRTGIGASGAAGESRSGMQAPAAPIMPAEPVAVAAPVAGPASQGSAAAVGTKYFVRLRGRQTGPFDFATLQRHARQGALSRLHQVSTDGANWRPVTTVDGLFGG